MPPRIAGPPGPKILTLCLRTASQLPNRQAQLQPLIQKANLSQQEKQRLAKQDPYRWAQMETRRAALVKQQKEIKDTKIANWGSPVHGITTPFIESFDSAGQASLSKSRTDAGGNPIEEGQELPTSPHVLDHHLTKAELDEAISLSYQLAKPLLENERTTVDPVKEKKALEDHEEHHRKAVIALKRITTLSGASSKGRMHANIRRCVETFGRHSTDLTLRPKPLSRGMTSREIVPRAGPDTGSSEVQIAILTAKIRVLAQDFEGRKGHKDKFNRRNLRLLCHRRQKLLNYMYKKEKCGDRWHHLIETLGLSPATYMKQIAI